MAPASIALPVAPERPAPPGRETFDYPADTALIDVVGIIGATVPGQHPVVFFVCRVAHGLKKLGVTHRTAHIFRRAAPGAIDERGVIGIGVTVADLFDDHVMAPVIAEIVNVEKPFKTAIKQGLQADRLRFVNRALIEAIVGKRLSVNLVTNIELEQMTVVSAHHDLDDVVKVHQC